MEYIDAESLKKFSIDKGAGALYIGTIGANEMLYTPPGAITFHRVLNAVDVIGVRAGFLKKDMVAGLSFMTALSAVQKAHPAVSLAIKALSESEHVPAVPETIIEKEPPAEVDTQTGEGNHTDGVVPAEQNS